MLGGRRSLCADSKRYSRGVQVSAAMVRSVGYRRAEGCEEMVRAVLALLVLLSVCLVVEAAPFACPAQEEAAKSAPRPLPRPRRQYLRYTTRYDRIDVDRVLASKRLVRNYIDCLLDRKPCPPDGAELKKILPDALHYNCSKCTPKQKVGVEKAMEKLSRDYKDEWIMLMERFDPEMTYRNRLLQKNISTQPTAIQTR